MSKVFIYRNVSRQYKNTVMYSVKNVKTQLVIDRSPTIFLIDATFKVSEAGRQRVLREKSKNVHAGVIGERTLIKPRLVDKYLTRVRVTYNPYKYETFINVETGEPIETAKFVEIGPSGVFAYL